MKITFIEPTPSPNTMKLHLTKVWNSIRRTYTPESERSAPALGTRNVNDTGRY